MEGPKKIVIFRAGDYIPLNMRRLITVILVATTLAASADLLAAPFYSDRLHFEFSGGPKDFKPVSTDEFLDELQTAEKRRFEIEKLERFVSRFDFALFPNSEAVDHLRTFLVFQPIPDTSLVGVSDSGSISQDSLFAEEKYREVIGKLLESDKDPRRMLAAYAIAGVQDSAFEPALVTTLTKEKNDTARVMLVSALLRLKSSHVSEMFDAVCTDQTIDLDQFVTCARALNADSMFSVAKKNYASSDQRRRALAIKLFSNTHLDDQVESDLRTIMSNISDPSFNDALHALAINNAGEIASLALPLVSDSKHRSNALLALSRSSTVSDNDALAEIADTSSSYDKALTTALFYTSSAGLLQKWLKGLREGKLTDSLDLRMEEQSLFGDAAVLPHIVATFNSNSSGYYLAKLATFASARDEAFLKSALVALLGHPSEEVRRAVTISAIDNHSDELCAKAARVLAVPNLRILETIDLLIECSVDTLHPIIAQIMAVNTTGDWNRACFRYLAKYPLPEHKKLFLNVAQDMRISPEYFFMSAEGLTNLGDTTWANATMVQVMGARYIFKGRDADKFNELVHKEGRTKALEWVVNTNVSVFEAVGGYGDWPDSTGNFPVNKNNDSED